MVKDRGGHVILECKKELRRLFEGFSGIDEFVEKRGDIVPDAEFDFYIHLMSLPSVFGTDLMNIPDNFYLKANSEIVGEFKDRFASDKFKVGLCWAGNPRHTNDKNRSMDFEKFMVLKGIKGIELFSLQKGGASKQLNDLEIIDMSDEIYDFADTAAIIESLDLIISVDSSVAHLAGAMGKPVWTLLSYIADWRWLLDRDDSPWYQSMRLFRQLSLGDWDSVLNKVKEELMRIL